MTAGMDRLPLFSMAGRSPGPLSGAASGAAVQVPAADGEWEAPMLWRRFSRRDPVLMDGASGRPPAPGRGPCSRGRRVRPAVECLEGRKLMAAITEFPIPSTDAHAGALTLGP